MSRFRRRVSLHAGLAVALAVNLALIGLYVWGQGGQTSVVEVRNRDGAFQAFTDGKQVVPGGRDERPAAVLDVPERGSIVLVLAPPVPTLPEPGGIESVTVIDSTGEVLFSDDFTFLDLEAWTVLSGKFQVIDGVLVSTAYGQQNSLLLQGEGWSNYSVRVTYRNSRGGVIGTNITRDGGVFYHFDLQRDFPAFFNVRNRGEEQAGATGNLMRSDYVGPLKSTANMLARPYPYMLAGLSLATLLATVLSVPKPPWPAGSRLLRRAASVRVSWPYAIIGTMAATGFATTLYLNATYYGFLPHVPDEVSYLFQANLLASFKITGDIPPVSEAFHFYTPPVLFERGDQWASFYPFGHPLALAIGVVVGAVYLVPSLVGAGTIALTFLVGRRLFDVRTGLVAGGLLLASPFFLMQAGSFMSHNTATLYFLLSLFFILKRDQPVLYGLLGGLFFGLALNTRALTAVALAPVFAALMLTYLATGKEDARTWLRHSLPFAVAGLLMLAALFAYNYGITGEWFTSPYTQTQGTDQELFGFREGHHLDIGLRNLQAQLMALLMVFNAWPVWAALALVMLPFVLGSRDARDYFLAACVLVPIAIYIGYRYSGIYEGPRYWYETMPFLVLLSARGATIAAVRITAAAAWLRRRLGWMSQHQPWVAGVLLYATVSVLIVYGTGGWLFGWGDDRPMSLVPHRASAIEGIFGVDDRLDRLADEMDLEDALVLVRPCGFFDSLVCYGSVFLRNLPDFDGEVVWARYDEDLNPETIAAFPGRTVYVATWEPLAIEPFPRP